MAAPNPRIRNVDVTPPVHAHPFAESPDSCFGIFALGRGLRANPLYTAYLELRTRVYTTQTSMLDVDALPYRLDIDDDDDRSFAFVVVKNTLPKPVAVACVRVIERLGSDNRPLPAEALYGLKIGAGSVEVSRYIGRLDDAKEQAQALSELLRSTIAHIRQVGADDDVYAIVERPLERILRIMGVGVARIAEPVWLEEYQGVNLALQLDPVVSAVSLGGLSEIEELDVSEGAVRFWGAVER